MASDRMIKLDLQFLLAMIPRWAHGNEEPTEDETVEAGGWEQVKATRERVNHIKERMKQLQG